MITAEVIKTVDLKRRPALKQELKDIKRDIELAKKVQKTLERHKTINPGHLPDAGEGTVVHQ